MERNAFVGLPETDVLVTNLVSRHLEVNKWPLGWSLANHL